MFERIRDSKDSNYTKVSNQFLRDRELSCKAKGMLTMIMSLPDDWDFSVEGFVTIVKESKNTIYGILDELKKNGYCRDYDVKNGNLKVDTNYIFYESPNEDAIQEYQRRIEEKAEREQNKASMLLGSQSQLSCSRDLRSRESCSRELNTNNNRLNQEKIQPIKERENSLSNSFVDNQKSHEHSECGRREKENLANASSGQKKKRRLPTLQEVQDYARGKDRPDQAELFFNYYSARGWKGIESWQFAFDTWLLRDNTNGERKPLKSSKNSERKRDKEYEDYLRTIREI